VFRDRNLAILASFPYNLRLEEKEPMAKTFDIPADDAELKLEIKRVIVAACEREIAAESIADHDILIGEDSALGLDSLDSLQAAVAISKRFGVRIQDSKHARRVMRSVTTLAEFVRQRQ
jgi:acyl carrier protein